MPQPRLKSKFDCVDKSAGSRPVILVAPAWKAMKKTELASLVEREAANARWIPAMLRQLQQVPELEQIATE